MIGVVRSFNSTASRAILPQLVPGEHFPNAVAWNASIFQAATILGPSFGGIIYAAFHGPSAVYVIALLTAIGATVSSFRIKPEVKARPREPMTLKTVFAGLHYIWRKKLILGAISLDLFAVLLGGAVALLPVYAREILHTGPWGLGLLRAAPGVGAAIMAVLLAHWPLRGRSGPTLLWAVAGFGIFTIIFAVSLSLTVSLIALLLLGGIGEISNLGARGGRPSSVRLGLCRKAPLLTQKAREKWGTQLNLQLPSSGRPDFVQAGGPDFARTGRRRPSPHVSC